MLQVGSYRNRPDAERLRDKLAKLGIDASMQHVAIDADEWHRVRIGPISDLAKLNATRSAAAHRGYRRHHLPRRGLIAYKRT